MKQAKGKPKCEVCNEPVKEIYDLTGCVACGRMFGPCCNSFEECTCVECSTGEMPS